jgi:hypothetical protein
MQDEKTWYPIPVITASKEAYDAMLMAEHVLIVAGEARADTECGLDIFGSRRCLINCSPDNIQKNSIYNLNDPRLKLMVGG